MAVSPLDFPKQEGLDQKATVKKVKSLAVRTGSNGVSNNKDKASSEAAPELAEQLNEEIKQRYIKGLLHCLILQIIINKMQASQWEKVHMPSYI